MANPLIVEICYPYGSANEVDQSPHNHAVAI